MSRFGGSEDKPGWSRLLRNPCEWSQPAGCAGFEAFRSILTRQGGVAGGGSVKKEGLTTGILRQSILSETGQWLKLKIWC